MQILIAEDDRNLRLGLAELLSAEGYVCDSVATGKEAFATFMRKGHPIVILDVVMPQENGLTVCRRIRKTKPDTQIMMLSARDEVHDRVLGMEVGADDYLTKPFDPRELLARVRVMERRSTGGTARSDTLQMADLEVNVTTLEARRGDRLIALTPKEANLLDLLYRNAGRPLTRDEIFNACWGVDYYPGSRALDQYVSALRSKIEKNPAEPLIIKTVRGIGYRFDDSH